MKKIKVRAKKSYAEDLAKGQRLAHFRATDSAGIQIAKLIISLGGDLNELIGYEKKKEIEVNSTVSLKETYEMRIADLVKSYETRIEDLKSLCELRISDVQRCCEIRISDIKKSYEERLAEQKEMLTK